MWGVAGVTYSTTVWAECFLEAWEMTSMSWCSIYLSSHGNCFFPFLRMDRLLIFLCNQVFKPPSAVLLTQYIRRVVLPVVVAMYGSLSLLEYTARHKLATLPTYVPRSSGSPRNRSARETSNFRTSIMGYRGDPYSVRM